MVAGYTGEEMYRSNSAEASSEAAVGQDSAVLDALIIGAGFAGLGMAIRLKKAGVQSFVVLEKEAEIGGTWWLNHYPNCACDVPAALYSFSFEPSVDWSSTYAPQPEIFNYLKHCAGKYRLQSHIRLRTEVIEAQYDDAQGWWEIATAQGARFRSRALICGLGALNRPAIPNIPGLNEYQGTQFHSAQWNHSFDAAGKRIAVIGTGASAVQFVPTLAASAAQLYVFQRTPPWILPKHDFPCGKRQRALLRWLPGYRRLQRDFVYWRNELTAYGLTKNRNLLRAATRMAREQLHAQVADPQLREKLTPDYTIGCKRILISNDYYPALGRSNVELVVERIQRVRAHSIATADGTERDVDAIVLGTGFRVADVFARLRITGRNDLEISEAWRDRSEAYLGLAVNGFPNLFMLAGPNTGIGHTSLIFMIEAQIGYIMRCLSWMREQRLKSLEVRAEVQRSFNRDLQQRMARTVWASGCRSWYQDRSGTVTALWPGLTVDFWRRTRRPKRSDFDAVSA